MVRVHFHDRHEVVQNPITQCMTGAEWSEKVFSWREMNLISKYTFDHFFLKFGVMPGMWNHDLRNSFYDSMTAFQAWSQADFIKWILHVKKTWREFYDMLIISIEGVKEERKEVRVPTPIPTTAFNTTTQMSSASKTFQFNYGEEMENDSSSSSDDGPPPPPPLDESPFKIKVVATTRSPPPPLPPRSAPPPPQPQPPQPELLIDRLHFKSRGEICNSHIVQCMTGTTWATLYCAVLKQNLDNPSEEEKLTTEIMERYFWPYSYIHGVWSRRNVKDWYKGMKEMEERFPKKFAYLKRTMHTRYGNEFTNAIFYFV